MYRINDNKRVQRSACLIKDAMLSCLAHKSFHEITVSDIQRLSGVSRATFYRIFDNTSDVLAFHCHLLVEDILEQATSLSLHSYKEFLLFLFEALLDNHLFLETVFRSDCEELLLNALLSNSMHRHAQETYPQADEKEMDYLISGICGFLIGILRTWIKHGRQETPEELFEIINKMSDTISIKLFKKQ